MARQAVTMALLVGGALVAAASVGDLGDEGGGGISSNSELNGCYTEPDSATMNSYWFDGSERCSHNMWTTLSGSVSYGCTYQVSEGRLELSYDDGSTESFDVASADNGIELNGNFFEYAGDTCS